MKNEDNVDNVLATFTGALIDERSDAEKAKDIQFGEIVGAATPVAWIEKPQNQWRKFPVLDQKNSFMCGAFSMKKLIGVYYWLKYKTWVDFSEEDIYQRRLNRPNAGMAVDDIYRIIGDGVTLKTLTNAAIITDEDADSCVIEPFKRDVGKVFKMGKKIVLGANIDEIASVIQHTGKAVHFMTGFTASEYGRFMPVIENPNLNLYAPSTLRHFITFTDFTLYNGKKCLVAEDSAHFGGYSQRLISEDWINRRTMAATYPMNFLFEQSGDPNKPHYTFTKKLEYSPVFTVVEDVKHLQDILKFEGLFPKNVESTGWYGSTTASSVMAFQKKYKVASDSEIDALQGKSAGPKTIAKLNELYGN